MKLSPGLCIRSTADMEDPNFRNSTVLISSVNAEGAIGFVINQQFSRNLNELLEFQTSPAFPLYLGGPVDQEHLFFIHRRPDLVTGSNSVIIDIYEGGDFSDAVRAINNRLIVPEDLKIFVGYCGWDAGELEAEIEEGSWEMIALTMEEIFE